MGTSSHTASAAISSAKRAGVCWMNASWMPLQLALFDCACCVVLLPTVTSRVVVVDVAVAVVPAAGMAVPGLRACGFMIHLARSSMDVLGTTPFG